MSGAATTVAGAAVNTAKWLVCAHSQTGSAHLRRGAINQDAVGWRGTPDGACFAGAVADGHGAPPYFRSDVGAQLAVRAALDCLLGGAGDAEGSGHGDAPDAARIAAAIERAWAQAVRAHTAAHPYEAAHRYEAGQAGADLAPYGSTLLAAAASPRWLVTAQIGDGDSFIGLAGRELQRIDAAQDQFEGEQTLSLCLQDAASYFTVRIVDLDWAEAAPDFIALSTDGVGKSFPNATAFAGAIAQFRKLCLDPAQPFGSVAGQIPAWLSEVSERGSGDDASLLIAVRKSESDVW